MDPYLEGAVWMSVHTQLSAEIVRQLAPRLRPKYLALTNERFVLKEPEAVAVMAPSLYPDVGVAEAAAGGPGHDGGVMTAPLIPEPVPHVTVEIRDTANRRLVTAIEVLSPTNKRGDGREEYLIKRRRILVSTAHLIEIDLLHQGQRVPVLDPLPPKPYFVFLCRAERRPVRRFGRSPSASLFPSCRFRSWRGTPTCRSTCNWPLPTSTTCVVMTWRSITADRRR